MEELYLSKLKQGDSSAFRYFITAYKNMAFNLAMSVLKDAFVAEEVVQDAFVHAYQGIRNFKGNSQFSTWFYRIVVNESLRRVQKEKRWKDRIPEVDDRLISTVDCALSSKDTEERAVCIQETLKLMPPNEALSLQLFYLNECSLQEVVNITGWSMSNVKVTLHRARKRFYLIVNEKFSEEIHQWI